MIGKSLRERHGVRSVLPPQESVALLGAHLKTHGAYLVQVREQGPEMVACLIVAADDASVRMCRDFGFEMKPGGTGVFGLPGAEFARVFPELPAHQRSWLTIPCRPHETKVLLVAEGAVGLLSTEAIEGTRVTTPIVNPTA